jgi:hypothetical protein
LAEDKKIEDNRLHLMTTIGIAVAILVYIYLPAANRFSDIRTELKITSSEAKESASEVSKLSAEKEALEKDPLYLEKVIRTELRMVRHGETN